MTMDKDKALDLPRLDEWVTLAWAAEVLGVSRMSVWKMVMSGRIKTAHILGHKSIVFRGEELEALVAEREQ